MTLDLPARLLGSRHCLEWLSCRNVVKVNFVFFGADTTHFCSDFCCNCNVNFTCVCVIKIFMNDTYLQNITKVHEVVPL